MGPTGVGNLLPNLKISVADTENITQPSEIQPIHNDSKVKIVRPGFNYFPNTKVYKNRNGGFTTGIDLIEEENSGVLEKRAERFELSCAKPKQSFSSLYESMGINFKTLDPAKLKHIRLSALYIRGVDEFSTPEVFAYFKEYGPLEVEWINDTACNVIFKDDASCARALLAKSIPLPDHLNPKLRRSSKKSDVSEDKGELPKSGMDLSTTNVSINIAIPPGEWRLGTEKRNGKNILLRFATTADKKLPGAEKKSTYYQKYGNPNYGGIRGYITATKRRKVQHAANRVAIGSHSRTVVSTESAPKAEKRQLTRTMYADVEEQKKKMQRSKDYGGRRSVKSRLGKKYTAEELCQLGTYKNYDNEDVNNFITDKPVKEVDLRLKIKNRRNDVLNQATSAFKQRKYEEDMPIPDQKKRKGSYYKRVYRSPLCMDDDDEEMEEEEP